MTDEAYKAKQELEQYRAAIKKAKYLNEKICMLRTRINATNREPREIDIQYTPDPKAVEELLVTLADLEKVYEAQKLKIVRLCCELEQKIDRISGVGGIILERKYIIGMTLDQIALALDYSLTQIKRLHVQALESYSRLFAITSNN